MELIYQKHKDQYIQENVLLNHKLNDNALLIFIYNSAFHKIRRDKKGVHKGLVYVHYITLQIKLLAYNVDG